MKLRLQMILSDLHCSRASNSPIEITCQLFTIFGNNFRFCFRLLDFLWA
jgi:hypothetical protein